MANAAWFSHYEPSVPHRLTYPDVPLQQFLEDAARRYPYKVATKLVLKHLLGGRVTVGGSLAYGQLNAHADHFAAALIGMQVKPGDRVALMVPSSPQYMIAFYGTLKAGAIVVNLDPAATADELRHQIADSGAETIVLHHPMYSSRAVIQAPSGVRHTIVTNLWDLLAAPARHLARRAQSRALEVVDRQGAVDLHWLEDLLSESDANGAQPLVRPDDLAVLQYTEGAAGAPKAVMLSHRNLVANTLQVVAFLPAAEPGKEKVMAAVPLAHVYGMTVAMNVALYLGGQMVLVPEPQPIRKLLRIIAKQRPTMFLGTPALYRAIVDDREVATVDLQSVKAWLSSSGTLPPEIQERFGELTQGRLVQSYGRPETAPATHCNPVRGEHRTGSIGLPLPDVEAKLVNPETGWPVRWGSDKAGALYVRGPNVMQGYWKRPAETAAILDEDGWLRTGDFARMDEEGYFYIVDPVANTISPRGEAG